MKLVTIYTDGACKGNPGPGVGVLGLAWVDIQMSFVVARLQQTFTMRMELMAVIQEHVEHRL